MMTVIRRSQMHVGDVGVDLRRRDIAVTKQRLHGARVRAVLQKMGCEAVPQRVRGNVFNSDLLGVILDHGPCKLPRERPPAM